MKPIVRAGRMKPVHSDIRGPLFVEAMKRQKQGIDILKLNTGNPATFGFGLPDSIKNALMEHMQDGVGYCDFKGMPQARQAICDYETSKGIKGITSDDVFIGNGVSEVVSFALTPLLNDGDEVLVPSPSYSLWGNSVYLEDGKPVFYTCDEQANWYPDIKDIRSKITDKTKAIVIINPNNPTGALYSKEILEEIVKIAEEFGLIIFSDEIYDRLVMDGLKHISIASIAPKNVFCVTFSGLSKSHMIAGFRVGWMVLSGNKKAAAGYIEGIKMLSNMRLCSNVPAQSIIQTALGGYQSVEEYLQPGGRIYEQREVIYKLLNDIPGVSAKKPKAAFYIFPKLDVEKFNIYDDEKFALDLLREKRILIVHGGGFNWDKPDHFRVVYLPRVADLEKATKKLAEFLDGYHQK